MDLSRVKATLNKTVLYNSREYRLTGCTIRCDEKTNEFYYQAELLDMLSQNSIIVCRLSDVEEKES